MQKLAITWRDMEQKPVTAGWGSWQKKSKQVKPKGKNIYFVSHEGTTESNRPAPQENKNTFKTIDFREFSNCLPHPPMQPNRIHVTNPTQNVKGQCGRDGILLFVTYST